MAPQTKESTALLRDDTNSDPAVTPSPTRRCIFLIGGAATLVVLALAFHQLPQTAPTSTTEANGTTLEPIGPYKLTERQVGEAFWEFYDFYEGADSLGSAGYNTYVNKSRAETLGISHTSEDGNVFMSSAPQSDGGLRESIRLEGKTRWERGLFILDMAHMPAGCGVWPAFWLTDEDVWPDHGEIDIVEGVNTLTQAKTALHTSAMCSMYAHVSPFDKTGTWDWATGIPNTWTGEPDFETNKEADDCWNFAAHQWFNQGCVAVDDKVDSIGEPVNEQGGAIYALEWDPANGYIRSWSFPRDMELPENLQQAIDSADEEDSLAINPDPDTWGLPYAYFAIGDRSGCSADHFQNMHIVFNLAFCGNVAGNRFMADCPTQSEEFNVNYDPVLTCNAWVASNPKVIQDEAYWEIRGVYVYEREMVPKNVSDSDGDDN